MKRILLTFLLVFGLVFALNTGANALPYPDPVFHPPLVWDDLPGISFPEFVEGSGMLSNLFTVPTGGTTITFDYNLITDEFWDPDDDGPLGIEPDVNDFFAVLLTDDTGTPLDFFYIADIFTSAFTPLADAAIGPHGSYFTYETGVVVGSVGISSLYEGMDITLGFGVFDLEDEVIDTAVLLDNISAPVPYGNFSGGLIGAGGFIIDAGEGMHMYSGNVHLMPDGSLAGVDTTGFDENYAYMSTGPEDMPPLTVVPEPISSTLFLIGAATLGFRRFRKKA